jgi:hypothetical protein
MFIYRSHVKQLGVLCGKVRCSNILACGEVRQVTWAPNSCQNAAGVQTSTHTFFDMLGRANVHASRFARKFAFGTRSGITSSCVVDRVQAHCM